MGRWDWTWVRIDGVWWATVVGTIALAVLPVQPQPLHVPAEDKFYHALLYGWVAWTALRWVRRHWPQARAAGWAWVAAGTVGALTEVLQAWVPYRSMSFFDWTADAVGAALLLALVQGCRYLRVGSLAGLTLLAVGVWNPPTPYAMDYWPVEDIRPGMRGEGHTTVGGNRTIRFDVEVLGRLSNVLPGLDVIIVKIDAPELANAGVFAGMSGSPVYIQGRLLGAVAYAWAFSKEPIAGVVPFASMQKLQTTALSLPGSPVPTPTADVRWSDLRTALLLQGEALDLWYRQYQDQVRQLFQGPSATAVHGWAPLPGIWAGDPVWRQALGLSVTGSLAGPDPARKDVAPTLDEPLTPGTSIAIPLVTGDLQLAYIGTLTAVERDRIYAFGHQMLNLGRIDFPLYRARVVTVLPSYQSSHVIAELDRPLGVLDVDVWTGVGGRVGPLPDGTRVQVTVQNESQSQTFRYETIRHPWIAPFLVGQLSMVNLLLSPLGVHDGHVRLQMKLSLDGGRPLEVRNVFAGMSATTQQVPQFIAGLLAFVWNNPFESVRIPSIEITLQQSRRSIQARLTEVRLLSQDLAPGDELPLRMTVVPRQAEPIVQAATVRLPDELAPGTYWLYVGGAQTLNQLDAAGLYRFLEFSNLSDILNMLRQLRPNDGLYVRLLRLNPTVISGTQLLRNLPLQVYSQLQSRGTQGRVATVPYEIVLDQRVDVPYIVEGLERFPIVVRAPTQPRPAARPTSSGGDD